MSGLSGVDLGDEITASCSNLKNFRDSDVIGSQNLPFPIDFARGPYHSASATVIVWCSVSVRPGKNVHLLFDELLWHKPTLHDFGIDVFHSKKARMYGTEIDRS